MTFEERLASYANTRSKRAVADGLTSKQRRRLAKKYRAQLKREELAAGSALMQGATK